MRDACFYVLKRRTVFFTLPVPAFPVLRLNVTIYLLFVACYVRLRPYSVQHVIVDMFV